MKLKPYSCTYFRLHFEFSLPVTLLFVNDLSREVPHLHVPDEFEPVCRGGSRILKKGGRKIFLQIHASM